MVFLESTRLKISEAVIHSQSSKFANESRRCLPLWHPGMCRSRWVNTFVAFE